MERLERGMGAREIGDDLGISRNAVYQQIGKLRRDGVLPDGDSSGPILDEVARLVTRSRARLDEITQEETALAEERDQITGLLARLIDVVPA
jgi:transposase